MRSLIVDDIEMNREMLAVFLEAYGEIACVESGEEAIDRVAAALAADRYFDLICLDISMPGMDGHETLRRIRQLESDRAVPPTKVFMVTASSSPEDMFDALLHGGCDDYVTKPLIQRSFQELLVKHGLVP